MIEDILEDILGTEIKGLGENLAVIEPGKILSVMSLGLDDECQEFLTDRFNHMIAVIKDYEEQKWKDFQFYCRYGYFQYDYIVNEIIDDETEDHF